MYVFTFFCRLQFSVFFLIYAEFVCKKGLGYSCVPLSEVLSVKSLEYKKIIFLFYQVRCAEPRNVCLH